MRVVTGIYPVLAIAVACGFASDAQKTTKRPAPPSLGIKTPGIRIPFADLKSELEFEAPAPPGWIGLADSILIPTPAACRGSIPRQKRVSLASQSAGSSSLAPAL